MGYGTGDRRWEDYLCEILRIFLGTEDAIVSQGDTLFSKKRNFQS